MMRPIFLVDAFADRPFAGNPAGVMILDSALPARVMQSIAAEMNQAETAFATRRGRAWDLRWFTPTQEVAFCGHATLATAHVLAAEHGASGEIEFLTREVGPLGVRIEGSGRYRLDLPRGEPSFVKLWELPFGVSGYRSAFQAGEVLCIEVETEADVRKFEPDFGLIAEFLPGGLCLTAPGDSTDMASRFFWPSGGIPEDHVTGSLHATLVPFWAKRLGRDRLTATQVSPRGGRLECELSGKRVHLSGSAVTVLRGHIDLPD
ncbi:PhzF family phenazine biosynthesis protein [Rubellimicrobium arenae]|uniref:PhzF family phenazine biosynthesis protein n=1 Tax=Rubellimicrobium arenae TaxID=2817372 RepID=UPI001B31871E|nr:PhzF family phenazine biosynthesis protein [Rubellimicrobium arenae]